ncbi:TetR family transcriptional regulator [Devosia sp. D6-9]|nr:TetR family transcriptional regulator [Devosia sp. D6-9]
MTDIQAAPRRESTEERRRAIAMAARQLIIEKGFEGLRTRDIADRVGINIATLHYHVPSKEALIALVAETIRDEFAEQGRRRPRSHLPPLRRLEMEFEDFRETVEQTPDLVAIFSEMLDRARRDPHVDDRISPIHAFWVQQLEEIFADGVADGTFRANLDPTAQARIVTGALGDFWGRSPNQLSAFDAMAAEIVRGVVRT